MGLLLVPPFAVGAFAVLFFNVRCFDFVFLVLSFSVILLCAGTLFRLRGGLLGACFPDVWVCVVVGGGGWCFKRMCLFVCDVRLRRLWRPIFTICGSSRLC